MFGILRGALEIVENVAEGTIDVAEEVFDTLTLGIFDDD